MLDHVSIQCADVAASGAFYDAVLAPLGGVRLMEFAESVGFGAGGKPEFWIGPRSPARGSASATWPSSAADRAAVTAFYDAAVRLGGDVLHPPRLWAEYHPNYFGAFVRHPDGNNVEAVCHSPG